MWSTTGLNIRTIALPFYINDIVNISDILQLILFANDNNLFAFHRDLNTLTHLVNHELELINT